MAIVNFASLNSASLIVNTVSNVSLMVNTVNNVSLIVKPVNSVFDGQYCQQSKLDMSIL